jgi:hypothetical protein
MKKRDDRNQLLLNLRIAVGNLEEAGRQVTDAVTCLVQNASTSAEPVEVNEDEQRELFVRLVKTVGNTFFPHLEEKARYKRAYAVVYDGICRRIGWNPATRTTRAKGVHLDNLSGYMEDALAVVNGILDRKIPIPY